MSEHSLYKSVFFPDLLAGEECLDRLWKIFLDAPDELTAKIGLGAYLTARDAYHEIGIIVNGPREEETSDTP